VTGAAPIGTRRRWRDSLGFRFVALMIVGEVAFGIALALVVGLIGVRLVAEQRVQALEDVSGVIAASLMPVIADQDQVALKAQLRSIVSLGQTYQIDSVRIDDSAGSLLAETGVDRSTEPVGFWDKTLQPIAGARTIVRQVVIDGIDVATVTVVFAPVGFGSVLATPLLAAALVVIAVGLISAPWSAWLVLRGVIEPVTVLRDDAVGIVQRQREGHRVSRRTDEIGELAATLDWMADELDAKDQKVQESIRSLQEAYAIESTMKDELEQHMRLKSDFVAVASHELRSPLATVRLYAEMLDSGVYGPLGEESRQAVASMVVAAARLTSIVSDLMDAALLERGLMPLVEADVDVGALVQAATADASLLASLRGIDVVVDAECDTCIVRGDAMRLRQVLDNLLSNAVKYSHDGARVNVRIRRTEDRVSISVEDAGRGMSEEGRDAIFELFGRLDSNDARDTAGIGLGLAIGRRIALSHRGRLYVERSAPGSGSVFVLELPVGTEGIDAGLEATVSVE
jgi:signal transduction histidine kinase